MADVEHSTLTGASLHAPQAHKTSHEKGGADEIEITELGALTADLDMAGNILYLDETNSNYITQVGNSVVIYVNGNYSVVHDLTEIIDHMNHRPISTNTKDLGTATYKWKDIYGTTLHGALAASEITGSLGVAHTDADITDATNVAAAGAVIREGSLVE